MSNPRIIALYLPQFHPFPENDEWWGKGYTEWRSVARAIPLFKGHYQPRIPADLGYYDLRLPIIRQQQVDLAKEAGIEGFCYWHYWFGNGKQLMEDIFNDVLESGKPDYPFCLGWANHSWYSKNWSRKDSNGKDKLLIEQTFPGNDDIRMHYDYALKAFKDPRYIKIDNKPFFMIYIADSIPNNFIYLWNKWAIEDGFDGIYFVGNVDADANPDDYEKLGFSAVVKNRMKKVADKYNIKINFTATSVIASIKAVLFKYPRFLFDYKKIVKILFDPIEDAKENVIPSLIPGFDHSPRSNQYGYIMHNSTPDTFERYASDIIEVVKKKENKIILLRSWNEWGEGNYMEPDLKWGKKYIEALRKALDKS